MLTVGADPSVVGTEKLLAREDWSDSGQLCARRRMGRLCGGRSANVQNPLARIANQLPKTRERAPARSRLSPRNAS